MDYNTQREKLKLPEYGRNIQIMVNHAKSIEDRDERNKAAETIILVMGSMNPPLKESRDYKHKLWDHLQIISGFDLDIDSPYETPPKEVLFAKPERMPYPKKKIRYMHYGKMAELMLEKAKAMEEGDMKDMYVKHVANHMKLSFMTWNKNSVPDNFIFKAVETMSNGELTVKPGTTLFDFKEPVVQPQNSGRKKKGGKRTR